MGIIFILLFSGVQNNILDIYTFKVKTLLPPSYYPSDSLYSCYNTTIFFMPY